VTSRIVTSDFREAVWALVRTVPPGRVTTYGEIAEAYYGVRKGSRGVGRALAGCPEDVPWWRVVRASGVLPPMRFAAEQRARLAEEGVPFTPEGRVALAAIGGVFSPPAPTSAEFARQRINQEPTTSE
jgi:alkylated DNA nucleotide flippase Atl1